MSHDNNSESEHMKIFSLALERVAEQAQTPIELIHLWVNIGRRMGVESIIPHLKVILYEHEENDELVKSIVGLIASPSSDVVEHLSSEQIFTEMVCNSSVIAIKKIKGGFH